MDEMDHLLADLLEMRRKDFFCFNFGEIGELFYNCLDVWSYY